MAHARGWRSQLKFGAGRNPPEVFQRRSPFYGKPSWAERDSGIDSGNIARIRGAATVGSEVERTFAGVDPDQVRPAICQLLLDPVDRDIRHHIVPVDPVHTPSLQLPLR